MDQGETRWLRSAGAERHSATVFELLGHGSSLRIRKRAGMLHWLGIVNKPKQKPHQALPSYPFPFRNLDPLAGGTTVALNRTEAKNQPAVYLAVCSVKALNHLESCLVILLRPSTNRPNLYSLKVPFKFLFPGVRKGPRW